MVRSVTEPAYDFLFDVYLILATLVGLFVTGWLAYALVRFRARPGASEPPDAPLAGTVSAERGHVIWIYVMAGTIGVILFGLVFGTVDLVNFIEYPPEEEDMLFVNVTAFQFGFQFTYPGNVSTFGELRVPLGRIVRFNVTSSDVLHNFAIPDFNIRVDAIPGRVTHLWFRAIEPGETTIYCAEFCGLGHAFMYATLIVLPEEEFEEWLRAQREPETAPGEARALAVAGGAIRADDASLPGEGPLRLRLANDDAEPHLLVAGAWSPHKWEREVVARTGLLGPGEETWLLLDEIPSGGALDVWCALPGHAEAGARLRLGGEA